MTLPAPVTELTAAFLAEVDERVPGRLTGLFLHGSLCWGEFFPMSDIDFVAVWAELPPAAELAAAHQATKARFPERAFDGFHCTAADLAAPPAEAAGHRPVWFRDEFDPDGTLDLNLVTWHELAERAVTIRGVLPSVYTSRSELREFTRNNLDTYWRLIADQIGDGDLEALGKHDDSVAFLGLGPARLHHLLTTGELTSKSGAGRYLLAGPDRRWHRIAREALRLRENPGSAGLYDDPVRRGADATALLRRMIADGLAAQ
ncbi:hypothetical protein GCM10010172_74640 [Paractinoplanes ferrugineus]|uniref:Nucleotidyltransferase-like protein n=1 Tax=Paractinoplanes ferrugineus TaxID=113564 RepID=A0A919IYF6_9ACTN|nr:hypothetical protein [Actinoplanes ferrugineus]GIE11381.1 hypothetical protein Afe05nite_32210 [Actinoplanes ferrugineus]